MYVREKVSTPVCDESKDAKYRHHQQLQGHGPNGIEPEKDTEKGLKDAQPQIDPTQNACPAWFKSKYQPTKANCVKGP